MKKIKYKNLFHDYKIANDLMMEKYIKDGRIENIGQWPITQKHIDERPKRAREVDKEYGFEQNDEYYENYIWKSGFGKKIEAGDYLFFILIAKPEDEENFDKNPEITIEITSITYAEKQKLNNYKCYDTRIFDDKDEINFLAFYHKKYHKKIGEDIKKGFGN